MVSVKAGQAAIETLFNLDGQGRQQYSEMVTILWRSLMAGELLPMGQGPHWPLIRHVCETDHTGKALEYLKRLPRVIGEVQQLLPAQEEVLLVTSTYHSRDMQTAWQLGHLHFDREWTKRAIARGSWLKQLQLTPLFKSSRCSEQQRWFVANMQPLANVARASVPGKDSLLRVLLKCEVPASYFLTQAGEVAARVQ